MLLYLMNNQILISLIEEVAAEIGDPNCKLTNPFILNQSSGTLNPWLSDFCKGTEFAICSDKILTLTEPNNELLEKYKELTK
jgi:hypothetical protein